jgi:N-acetylglucosamine-6-sulfatase
MSSSGSSMRLGFVRILMSIVVVGVLGVVATLVAPVERSAAQAGRLNLVLILTDDQNTDVSKMPYVNGRSDWIRFSRNFVNNPLCCPSRATILSGQYSHHTGVEQQRDGRHLNDSSTIATWLHEAGYRTSFVGKYLNHYPWQLGTYTPPGWDDWHAYAGQTAYYNYALIENGTQVSYGGAPADYATDVLARKAIRFLRRPNDRPFFLVFAPFAPHNPATPAPRHVGAFANLAVPHSPSFNEADISDKSAWWQTLPFKDPTQMDAAVRHQYETDLGIDDAVRGIFDTLADTGHLDNTVVIYTSDNGVAFGEHRWAQKQCPYDECVHTPLLIRYPGLAGGERGDFASNVDFAPSLADFAGVRPASPVDGYSLRSRLFGTGGNWRSYVLLHGRRDVDYQGDQPVPPTWWALRSKRFKYIEWKDTGERELYDLVADPFELQNVAGRDAYHDKVDELHTQLMRFEAEQPRTVS